MTRPSLEDVYLELTEASLDAAVAVPRAWWGAAWRQYRLERRMFWRNPSAAFFGVVLPLGLLAIFGAVFAGRQEDLDVIVPGIAGAERDVGDVHVAGLQPHDAARARHPQAPARHAAADVGLPRRARGQRDRQRRCCSS